MHAHVPSLVCVLFLSSLAGASHSPFRHRAPQMASLSLPTPTPTPTPSVLPTVLPSLSLPSLSSPSSSAPVQSTQPSSPSPSTPTPTPTPSSTSSPSPSSSSSSPTHSAPTLTPTSTAPTDVAQQSAYPSSTPTPVAIGAGVSDTGFSSSVVVYTSATITPSPTVTSSSPTGFFDNTGAVAGTFTVVGLVGIAGVIAVALLVVRRRNSRSYEDDMEHLDRTPNLSTGPPMTQVTSPLDDGVTSDQGHYGASPMALATPPAAYYPDHAYALHPQAFSPDSQASHGYPSFPAGYTQSYTAQRVYSPDDYDIAYSPSTPRVDPSMPNPHGFAGVELDSAPVPPTQTIPPGALRPSVKPSPSVPKQWAPTRFSVDSFYTGIATDNHPSPRQAP